MALPILSYGHNILNKRCGQVEPDYPELESLIENMWETLYTAAGSGLAAPQVNHGVQLFIVDSEQMFEAMDEAERQAYFSGDSGIRETFINACITYTSANKWTNTEGCLSMPGLNVDVERPWTIKVEYLDSNFQEKKKEFSGITARIIQHEFDHTQGILFLHYLSTFKRSVVQKKLHDISCGQVSPSYAMQFLETGTAFKEKV